MQTTDIWVKIKFDNSCLSNQTTLHASCLSDNVFVKRYKNMDAQNKNESNFTADVTDSVYNVKLHRPNKNGVCVISKMFKHSIYSYWGVYNTHCHFKCILTTNVITWTLYNVKWNK